MLNDEKIKIIVEDYIGVNGGYLGDFSYKKLLPLSTIVVEICQRHP